MSIGNKVQIFEAQKLSLVTHRSSPGNTVGLIKHVHFEGATALSFYGSASWVELYRHPDTAMRLDNWSRHFGSNPDNRIGSVACFVSSPIALHFDLRCKSNQINPYNSSPTSNPQISNLHPLQRLGVTLLPWESLLDGADQALVTGRSRFDGDLERLRVADHPRRELDPRLDHPAVADRLGQAVHGERLRHVEEDGVVGEDASRADAPAVPEDELLGVGFRLVALAGEKALGLEGRWLGVLLGVAREVPAGLEGLVFGGEGVHSKQVQCREGSLVIVSAVHHVPDVGHHHGALGDEVALEHVVFRTGMREPHGPDGVPPHQLLHYRVDVRQPFAVVGVGQPVLSHDAVDLFLGLLLNLGIHHHGQEERGDGGYCLQELHVSPESRCPSIHIPHDPPGLGGDMLGRHTVSAPPPYIDSAMNLSLCSFAGEASSDSRRRERNETLSLPCAIWCSTKAYGLSLVSSIWTFHCLAICLNPVPGNQSGR